MSRYVDDVLAHLVIITLIFILVVYWTDQNNLWGDLYNYWNNAFKLFSGQLPYRDFTFEYPPVAILVFSIPYAVASDVIIYHYAFAFLAYLAVIVCYWFGRQIGKRYGVRSILILILIATMLLFANYYVVSRYDIFPAAMVLVSFWFLSREKYLPAFVIMALAAMLKIYPIIFIPLMLCIFINRRNYAEGAKYLVLSVAVCVICEVPFFLADPSTSFDYLTYHSDRRIQVEAVIAGVLQMYGRMNPGEVWWVNEYGADHLAGPLPDALAPWINPVMMIIVAVALLFMIWRIRRTVEERFWPTVGLAFALLMMIFLTVNKVYSNQYMIWACGIIPLALIGVSGIRGRRVVLVTSLIFMMMSGVQTLWFHILGNPWTMDSFDAIQMLKNISHILLLVVLAFYFMKVTGCGRGKQSISNDDD